MDIWVSSCVKQTIANLYFGRYNAQIMMSPEIDFSLRLRPITLLKKQENILQKCFLPKIQPGWFLNLFLIFSQKFSLISYKRVSYKKKTCNVRGKRDEDTYTSCVSKMLTRYHLTCLRLTRWRKNKYVQLTYEYVSTK